ncbi:MAG: PAS domain-containing protein, partial [bacterium]
MNSKRIFTAPAVLTAVLILGSVSIIIYSQWVIGKTLDRHKALVTLSEIAKRKILLAHLWFEEALAGDQSVNLDQNVYRNIDETLDLISTGLENLQGELKDVTKALMRGDLATAKEKIQGWRKLAEVRWENREDTGETGGELDQEFDAIFRDILVRLQNFSDELNFFIAQDRRKLKWFSVLHVLLLVAICGSTGAIVFRYQRAIKAKNEELEISLKERTFSLARSEKLIRSILSSAVDGIISIDEHGIVELFNPAAERMFGYRADEIIGKTVTLLMPEPYKSEHGEYMRNYLRTGKSNIIGIGIEVVGQRKNGSIFPMELAVSEVRLDDRRLFAGIARDISERKKMEEKIRQFSRAVEQSPASVMITDTHGNIEYANLKFTQVTGYSFEEVEGKNPRFLKSG